MGAMILSSGLSAMAAELDCVAFYNYEAGQLVPQSVHVSVPDGPLTVGTQIQITDIPKYDVFKSGYCSVWVTELRKGWTHHNIWTIDPLTEDLVYSDMLLSEQSTDSLDCTRLGSLRINKNTNSLTYTVKNADADVALGFFVYDTGGLEGTSSMNIVIRTDGSIVDLYDWESEMYALGYTDIQNISIDNYTPAK